ncbi:methyltransferase [Idiomarina xiamenensis]|uniref:Ribosomal RNA small subunit methyltransferase D n=1 Tax=Idiomarina xiamenensis 10-D-4 TaxID=740709 RepID=K2KJT7_9GAMM|nr:methyltransferase [Idiomarina xiamenensis]EKE82859.1 ribosomal RNA small subunit methyltransferase D [Idiomarina xiamenensis 10-D-4]
MSNTETALRTPFGDFQLRRIPYFNRSTLRAWDAADEWLINSVAESPSDKPLLIINDSFASLATVLHQFQPTVSGDSYLSQLAIQENARLNQLTDSADWQYPLPQRTQPQRVLMKLPQSQALLTAQLQQLNRCLAPASEVLVCARSQYFTPKVKQAFADYLGEPEVSLIKRKCRQLRLIKTREAVAHETIDSETQSQWRVPEHDLTMVNHAGVFAQQQLDIGARFMLQHLPQKSVQQVIDLGCGNGVLGLAYARQHPTAQVSWVDESYSAIASAKDSLLASGLQAEPKRYQFVLDNCLSKQANSSADLILCNPPFHQENAITDGVARQMFGDAKRVLRPGGELRIVANRHLGYHQHLKRLFGGYRNVAGNPKFAIISTTRKSL